MYESMKKAAAMAAPTMAATPVVAPIGNRAGRRFYSGDEYVHTGPLENPSEKLRGEVAQAQSDLDELRHLISRAKALCDRAERAPYQGGDWSATPTPEQKREIARARKALEDFSSLLPSTFKTWIDRLEKFNVQLRENLKP